MEGGRGRGGGGWGWRGGWGGGGQWDSLYGTLREGCASLLHVQRDEGRKEERERTVLHKDNGLGTFVCCRERKGETGRQTDRQTDRQTQTERQRQREREKEKHRQGGRGLNLCRRLSKLVPVNSLVCMISIDSKPILSPPEVTRCS